MLRSPLPRWDGLVRDHSPSISFSMPSGRQESLEAIDGGSPKCQALSQKSCGLGDLISRAVVPHAAPLPGSGVRRTHDRSLLCLLLATCLRVNLSVFPKFPCPPL